MVGNEAADRTDTGTIQSVTQSAIERAQNALTASNADPAAMNSDQRKAEIGRLVGRRVTDGQLAQPEQDRLAALVAAEAGISQDEARTRIQQTEQEAQQALQRTEEQARRPPTPPPPRLPPRRTGPSPRFCWVPLSRCWVPAPAPAPWWPARLPFAEPTP
ncbi:hypothetical protein [Teichococcus aestuarii]|uniref:hypothetical protein n=1 Tax=Teichococcus aestuarii TaxID=568898 RepID=UPI00361D95AC